MIDVDLLGEAYTTLKQYIHAKDRQEAADALMGLLVDSLTDEELKEFSGIDSKLAKAYKEYAVDEDEEEDDYNADHDE
jgi:hypothetical protein